jgi:hypothetical protein
MSTKIFKGSLFLSSSNEGAPQSGDLGDRRPFFITSEHIAPAMEHKPHAKENVKSDLEHFVTDRDLFSSEMEHFIASRRNNVSVLER